MQNGVYHQIFIYLQLECSSFPMLLSPSSLSGIYIWCDEVTAILRELWVGKQKITILVETPNPECGPHIAFASYLLHYCATSRLPKISVWASSREILYGFLICLHLTRIIIYQYYPWYLWLIYICLPNMFNTRQNRSRICDLVLWSYVHLLDVRLVTDCHGTVEYESIEMIGASYMHIYVLLVINWDCEIQAV